MLCQSWSDPSFILLSRTFSPCHAFYHPLTHAVPIMSYFILSYNLCIFLSSLQGKKNSVFRECYFGNLRHCKLTRLYPACGYTFRVAAHNDIGTRYCYLLY